MSRKHLSIFMGLSMLLTIGACQDSPCAELVCTNGTCLEGICECTKGFEGQDCAQKSKDKFLGEWTVGEICSTGSTVYESTIISGDEIDQLWIQNLKDTTMVVEARVQGIHIQLPSQAYGQWVLNGTGQIDTTARQISMDCTVDFGAGTKQTCFLTFYPH